MFLVEAYAIAHLTFGGWGLLVQVLAVEQEGGGVSRVNIGSLITASVTSRHTSVIFKMAGKFLVRYVAKDVNFPSVWIHLLPSSMTRSF